MVNFSDAVARVTVYGQKMRPNKTSVERALHLGSYGPRKIDKSTISTLKQVDVPNKNDRLKNGFRFTEKFKKAMLEKAKKYAEELLAKKDAAEIYSNYCWQGSEYCKAVRKYLEEAIPNIKELCISTLKSGEQFLK